MKASRRKALCMILAVALCLGLLAGCASSTSNDPGDAISTSDFGTPTESSVETENEPEPETGEMAEADTEELVGTLEDITMDTITIRLLDGRVLTLDASKAEHTFSYGINEGNWLTVIYKGVLNGTDTSGMTVIRIHDEDTDHVKEVKAQTTIEDVDETVYALEDVGVRSSYMMASESVGELKAGESVKRTGHCNNGWDRIIFNGAEAYVYGTLLTTDENELGNKGSLHEEVSQVVKIKALNETVYAKLDATVREGYSTASRSVGALKAGTSVTRTGICDNGWSRISFDGRNAYVYSDLLTTKNPNSESDGVRTTAVNETVFVVADANVRKSFSEKSEAIGSLKFGDSVVRTGICDNGWSRIVYKDKDAYISSNLISKTNPVQVKTVTIYVTDGVAWTVTDANLRESFSVESKSQGVLKKGTSVKITGVTDNGWSRVSYDGKKGFIHNDLLTSVDPNPAKPSPAPSPTATPSPSPSPTASPAPSPTAEPSPSPTTEPSAEPTTQPSAEPSSEPVEEKQIEGTVVGYDMNTITIEATDDEGKSSGPDRPEEEPELNPGQGGESFPSTTYDEADGEVMTYYTFDIREASQSYSHGIREGITVRITYVGELSKMEKVRATKVETVETPEDVPEDTPEEPADEAEDTAAQKTEEKQQVTEAPAVPSVTETPAAEKTEDAQSKDGEQANDKETVYTGEVVSVKDNTVTVKLEKDVKRTFSFEKIKDKVEVNKLTEGTKVKVTVDKAEADKAEADKAKTEETVLTAKKIEIQK